MAEQLPPTAASLPPDRRRHHIASIAHLFFAEEGIGSSGLGETVRRSLAVTCFNDTPIAAYAAGRLAGRTRQLAVGHRGRGVRLSEGSGLAWSARSFVSEALGGPPESLLSGDQDWYWPADPGEVGPERVIHWARLGGRAPAIPEISEQPMGQTGAGPQVHGLVVCLLAREVADLVSGLRLGRALGRLDPERLEVLVFPDDWSLAQEAPRRHGTRFGRSRGGGELLVRCRELSRALGGACPLTITQLPTDGSDGGAADTATILNNLAARLIGDFWVDPGS